MSKNALLLSTTLFDLKLVFLLVLLCRTIPFAWNLITAGYVEQSVHGVFMYVLVSTIGLLFIGKLLEPVWGPREFLKFIFLVNFLTSLCIFITFIAFYYITRQESYLYMPLSGFHGVIFWLLGWHQANYSRSRASFPQDKSEGLIFYPCSWLPSIALLCSIATSFWTLEATSYSFLICLRYWQRKPETKHKGDPNPIASIFHRMLFGRDASDDAQGYTLRGEPLPGSDPIEASRRREIGARALEKRLAIARSAEELQTDATENV
ncbi:Rhomboid-like protein 19 [Glycine max]|nr:Rhomboid-like protein 19 [Glycine max]